MYEIKYPTGSTVMLEYDDEKHTYMVDGNKIPSVTRVIDSVTPKHLTDWAATAGADYWERNRFGHGANMYEGIRNAYKEIGDTAKDIGSEVHKWIELWIKFKITGGDTETDYPDHVKIPMQNFHKWVESRAIEWVSCEEKIYSKAWKFAGTVDAVARINGKLCVIDFKTSAKVYKEYYLQLAAYSEAISSMMGEDVNLGVIVRLDKEEDKFQEVAFKPENYFYAFVNALELKAFQSERIKKEKL